MTIALNRLDTSDTLTIANLTPMLFLSRTVGLSCIVL